MVELLCERLPQVSCPLLPITADFSIAGYELTGSFKNYFGSFLICLQAVKRLEVVWFMES